MTATVPYAELKLEGDGFQNPRQYSGLDHESIVELAITIGLHGLLNHLRVTSNSVIRGGQRRYRAIGYLIARPDECAARAAEASDGASGPALQMLFRDRAADLKLGVPVIFVSNSESADGAAMVDNLHRVELTSYEIAAEIARRHLRGDRGAKIALSIGRSPSYVSKAYKAWRSAGEALKAAWRAGTVSYDRVKELADLHEEEQERAIGGGKPRGGYSRPGIEAVKHVLDTADRAYGAQAAPESYARAVLDALRWVAGQQSSAKFAEFMESIEP